MGSVAELETQVLLTHDLGFLQEQSQEMLLQQLDDIGKMLRGLHRALKQRTSG
jgi:four helix bundle protein